MEGAISETVSEQWPKPLIQSIQTGDGQGMPKLSDECLNIGFEALE